VKVVSQLMERSISAGKRRKTGRQRLGLRGNEMVSHKERRGDREKKGWGNPQVVEGSEITIPVESISKIGQQKKKATRQSKRLGLQREISSEARRKKEAGMTGRAPKLDVISKVTAQRGRRAAEGGYVPKAPKRAPEDQRGGRYNGHRRRKKKGRGLTDRCTIPTGKGSSTGILRTIEGKIHVRNEVHPEGEREKQRFREKRSLGGEEGRGRESSSKDRKTDLSAERRENQNTTERKGRVQDACRSEITSALLS